MTNSYICGVYQNGGTDDILNITTMGKFNGKKVGEVFETKDYTIFKPHTDNRVTKPNHVKKLEKSMRERGWLKSSTIKVNEKFQMIDGHHRLLAATKTGTPVRYTVVIGAKADEITEINTNSMRWSSLDHIHKFVVRGNANYVKLDEFMKKFPMFRFTEALMFCRNAASSVDTGIFESGGLIVRDMKKAEEWANNVVQLKPYFEKYYNKSIFVRAMIRIMSGKPEFSFEEFLHKVQLRPGSIHPCGTVDQYIEMIEKCYNNYRSKKVNLRF